MELMKRIKHKVSMKCECGHTVSAGSVFCPYCKEEILKKNAKVIMKEEKKYQIKMRGKGKKKKKK
jgi:hypothetical protein